MLAFSTHLQAPPDKAGWSACVQGEIEIELNKEEGRGSESDVELNLGRNFFFLKKLYFYWGSSFIKFDLFSREKVSMILYL